MGARLFHTLDPTTRSFRHEGRTYLVTDTVGFIRKLPHQLVEAFKATLEETVNADLILHVADASVPEEEMDEMTAAVDEVLEEIGAGAKPRLLVLNKIDQLDPDERRMVAARHRDAVPVSALDREGLEELRRRIEQKFRAGLEAVDLLVPYERGAALSELHDLAGDLEREDTAAGVRVKARVPAAVAERLRPYELNGHEPRLIVEFQRLTEAARAPARANEHDAGWDLRAAEAARLDPGARASVGTGVAVAIPEGHAGLVLPRSGLAARHGIALVNAPGLIDAGYRGEVRVLLLNTDRVARFEIEVGDRIAQLVITELPEVEFAEAPSLSETARGAGGFGSTGVA